MKTSKGLVEYAKKALAEKYGYIWGTFGQVLTYELLETKLKQYPIQVGKFQKFIETHWMHRKVTDCVGLIKSYLWFEGDKCRYDGKTDLNANQMYERATVKGTIDTIPDRPGICVWAKGHIGVYIGGGEVIESRGTRVGVIKSPLKGSLSKDNAFPWTHWLEVPFITYEKPPAPPKGSTVEMPLLKLGACGDNIKSLQRKLKSFGYDLLVDGTYGVKTQMAVKEFQKRHNLKADGIVGPATWIELNRS